MEATWTARAIQRSRIAGSLDEVERFLPPLLHGLYALCRAHVESEDDAYITVLEAMLSTAQAESLARNYEAALESPESFPNP